MLNDKTRQFHLQCSLENQSTRVCVCLCVAQRTAVAHFVCLTPAPLCLQQFVGSGNSKAAPIVICKMFVCICVFFRVTLWGVVCVYHKTKPYQNKRMRKMKTNKRKRSNESGKSIISGQGSLFPWRELTAGWGRGKILWLLSPPLAPPPPPLLLPIKHNIKIAAKQNTAVCKKVMQMFDWQHWDPNSGWNSAIISIYIFFFVIVLVTNVLFHELRQRTSHSCCQDDHHWNRRKALNGGWGDAWLWALFRMKWISFSTWLHFIWKG